MSEQGGVTWMRSVRTPAGHVTVLFQSVRIYWRFQQDTVSWQ